MDKNSRYLKSLHNEILSIMDEIDRVCKENGFRYYLIGGSLLGAVRHRGFIPWDDDLDIVMPRDDLNQFIAIADKVLKKDFQLEWITTNDSYFQIFPKVAKKGTEFKEEGLPNSYKMGIFVDIFPLDASPDYCRATERIKRRAKRLRNIAYARTAGNHGHHGILYRILSLFFSNRFLSYRITKVLQTASKLGQTHYANFGSQYSLRKQTMPIEWYGEGDPIQFEDREYIAPKMKEKVLTSIFGPNYMQLPPEEKRRTHYPEYVVFSNGETILFDKAKHKVSIDEQMV